MISSVERKHGKIALIGGVFDGIHPGHAEFVKKAKSTADFLVVLLEHDQSVEKKKGPGRPKFSQNSRAQNLLMLEHVDYIVLLPSDTSTRFYFELVKRIRPDIIAITKGDPELENKKAQAKSVKGKIIEVMNRNKKYSSTYLINKKTK